MANRAGAAHARFEFARATTSAAAPLHPAWEIEEILDASALALLFVGGVTAGIVNTLAGGGSMLTVPLLVTLGLPGTLANGTNRIGVLVQSLAATWRFRRDGVEVLASALPVLLPVGIGALVRALALTQLADDVFERAFALVMLADHVCGGSADRGGKRRAANRTNNVTRSNVNDRYSHNINHKIHPAERLAHNCYGPSFSEGDHRRPPRPEAPTFLRDVTRACLPLSIFFNKINYFPNSNHFESINTSFCID